MKAEQILNKHVLFSLDMEKKAVIKAMKEYAEQKCREQRFSCYKLNYNEDILEVKLPNFD